MHARYNALFTKQESTSENNSAVYDANTFLSILDAFICLSYSINRAFEQTVIRKLLTIHIFAR